MEAYRVYYEQEADKREEENYVASFERYVKKYFQREAVFGVTSECMNIYDYIIVNLKDCSLVNCQQECHRSARTTTTAATACRWSPGSSLRTTWGASSLSPKGPTVQRLKSCKPISSLYISIYLFLNYLFKDVAQCFHVQFLLRYLGFHKALFSHLFSYYRRNE